MNVDRRYDCSLLIPPEINTRQGEKVEDNVGRKTNYYKVAMSYTYPGD